MTVNWKGVVEVIKEEVIPSFSQEEVKPTLRTIFYALVARNTIPNTKSSYKRLSEVLVKARKDGVFQWDFIEDRVRYAIKNFDDYRVSEEEYRVMEVVCRRKVEEIDLNKLLSS